MTAKLPDAGISIRTVDDASDLNDLIALRLAWKPTADEAEAVTLAEDVRAWWETNGAGRRV